VIWTSQGTFIEVSRWWLVEEMGE